MTEERAEHPGPGLVVALVKRVREYAETDAVDAHNDLLSALEALEVALEAEAREADQEEPGHWEPGHWMGVKDGDRVRLGGTEARVVTALHTQWPGSGARQVNVVLEGWNDGKPYTMKPSNPVDIWRPALPDWAAHAFQTLAAAGLKPERAS